MFKLPKLPCDSENGIAPIFILFLLVVAIIGGTFLVQNRTNINPFAAESSECETKIDDDVCIKKGVNPNEYKPDGSKVVFIERPLAATDANISCGQSQGCGDDEWCYDRVDFPRGTQEREGRYQCSDKVFIETEVISTGYNIGKFTVVDNSECNNICSQNSKCVVIHNTIKPENKGKQDSLGNVFPEEEYLYSCYLTDVIKKLPANKLNSVFLDETSTGTTPSVSANPNPCVVAAGQKTCKVTFTWDSKQSQNIKLVVHSGTELTTSSRIIEKQQSAKGSYEVSFDPGEFNVYIAKEDNTKIASTKLTVQATDGTGTQPTAKSPASDYSQYTTKENCERAIPTKATYCTDAGRLVNEKTVWQKDPADNKEKCMGKQTDVKGCTSNDEYKNGDKYGVPAGQASSGIAGANKPIVDGKISPELQKLAEECGMVKDGESTLGIPFFKISTGQNLSVNREDCKQLLATQLTYFEQANKEAARKLMEEAEKIGATVEKKEDGTYEVKGDLENEEVKKLAEKVKTVNEAQTAVTECKGKTGEEQANCLKTTQEKTQGAATAANAAVLQGYVKKFDQIMSGDLGGKDEVCVKADLGVAPFMDSEGIGAAHVGEEYRLLLCRAKSNLVENGGDGRFKWRVLLLDSSDGDCSTKEKEEEEKPTSAVLGMMAAVGPGAAQPGTTGGPAPEKPAKPCVQNPEGSSKSERLSKLHPGGAKEPVFAPPVVINTCVKISSNKKEDIEAILKPYIDAARAGTGKAAGCERTPRKPDTPEAGTGTPPSGGTPANPANPANPAEPAEGGAIDYTGVSRETDGCSADLKWVTKKDSKGVPKNDFNCDQRGKTCAKGEGDRYGCR